MRVEVRGYGWYEDVKLSQEDLEKILEKILNKLNLKVISGAGYDYTDYEVVDK